MLHGVLRRRGRFSLHAEAAGHDHDGRDGKSASGASGSQRSADVALLAMLAIIFAVIQASVAIVRGPARPGRGIGSAWYKVDGAQVRGQGGHWADRLKASFVESRRDAETDAFLRECASATVAWTGRVRLRFLHQVCWMLQAAMGWSRTDAIAFLDIATMLPVTRQQLTRVIGAALPSVATILDIGAGKGTVTAAAAEVLGVSPLNVTAIETSEPLRRGLSSRGYRALRNAHELQPSDRFDAVLLLHVLDRCDEPRQVLAAALSRLAPGGLLVLATVLPFCPRVFEGRLGAVDAGRTPRGLLEMPAGATCKEKPRFEKAVVAFAAALDANHSHARALELVAWTRLPYLSEAIGHETHHSLHSALFVLRRAINFTDS